MGAVVETKESEPGIRPAAFAGPSASGQQMLTAAALITSGRPAR